MSHEKHPPIPSHELLVSYSKNIPIMVSNHLQFPVSQFTPTN
jgi:hypothetical protein